MKWKLLFCCFITLMLAACGTSRKGAYYKDDGPPQDHPDLSTIKDAVPTSEPLSRTGNKPYVVFGKQYVPLKSNQGFRQKGTASWYGKKFHGKRTSSGESYDMYKMTAAHTVLPIPSYARVTNLRNKRSIIVKVNDRGPFKHNRVMDLSYAAALKLDVVRSGTAPVEIVALSATSPRDTTATVPANDEKIYIQLAAFSNQDMAYRLQQRLRSDGYANAQVSTVNQGQLKLYRVRLGPMQSSSDIDFILADIHHAGHSGAHVIVEPAIQETTR